MNKIIKKIPLNIFNLNLWPNVDHSKNSFLDQTLGMKLEISFVKGMLKIITIIAIVSIFSNIYFYNKASQNLSHQRIILVPAINRKLVIPADSYISETYVQAVSKAVVQLNEVWSYDGYLNNINELCRDYYSREQCELVRANLKSMKREEFVRENKMFSQFTIDQDKSEYHYCEQLKRPCSMVIGKRKLFFNNNDKVIEKEVGYLLIGENIWPDENNPFALRISRLKINEEEDPRSKLLPQLELAMKGDKSAL